MYVEVIFSSATFCERTASLLGCSLCIMSIYNSSYFPFCYQEQDFDFDCSWSLLTFDFYRNGKKKVK